MVIHRTADHGFGCVVGALIEITRIATVNHQSYDIDKARKEEWATNVAQYSKNTE